MHLACAKGLEEIEGDEKAAKGWLNRLPLPENIRLPRNSDAEFYYDMFSPRQLAGLAMLRQAIDREGDGDSARLAFAGLVGVCGEAEQDFPFRQGPG